LADFRADREYLLFFIDSKGGFSFFQSQRPVTPELLQLL
jgi:hypothetical protein